MNGTYPRKATITNKTQKLLDIDNQYISPSYTREFNFIVEGGHGREVIDVEGNYYLDFGAGIAVTSTGHCHPKVVHAIIHQASKLIHMSGTDFYYKPQIDLAEKLSSTMYEDDYMCFFANSGAEAVEAAMKLARHYTGRPAYIAFTGAFHGRTLGSVSLTGSKAIQRKSYQPLQPVVHAPYANCQECWFGSTDKECQSSGFRCLDYLEKEVLERTLPPEDCAAIFVEAIQGEGGYIVPPDGWLSALQDICNCNGVLLVIDEVQSGMARTGKWWAHQNFDKIRPDIITSAKGIASGMPLGVMIAAGDLMSNWPSGSHATTFGGNPIACAAANATIKVIEEEDLMQNAIDRGDQLRMVLFYLSKKYTQVANPRGMGLMRAVDIIDGRDEVITRCFEKGLILLGCGKSGIRFCPALNVTEEEVDVCIAILDEAIKEVI